MTNCQSMLSTIRSMLSACAQCCRHVLNAASSHNIVSYHNMSVKTVSYHKGHIISYHVRLDDPHCAMDLSKGTYEMEEHI
jgi:hypothetical protein